MAQLIFSKVELPHFIEVDELPPTTRNAGGFGSTGLFDVPLGEEQYLMEQMKWDEYFMGIAVRASFLSDCLRGAIKNGAGNYVGSARRFGCIITKNRNIIAQGFNRRTSECSLEQGCIRERENIPSGTSNDRGCLHAEYVAVQNHGMSGGTSLIGATVYINAEPCIMCAKLLIGCGISAIVVPEGVYPNNGLKLFEEADIEIRHAKIDIEVPS